MKEKEPLGDIPYLRYMLRSICYSPFNPISMCHDDFYQINI